MIAPNDSLQPDAIQRCGNSVSTIINRIPSGRSSYALAFFLTRMEKSQQPRLQFNGRLSASDEDFPTPGERLGMVSG
jgi:hypothetical protein